MAPAKKYGWGGKDPKIEATLNSHVPGGSSAWRYEAAFDLKDAERNPESQSRIGSVDKRYVAELVAKAKATMADSQPLPFPPIVLWETDDNGCVIIEGNHRVATYLQLGIGICPAYLVKLANQSTSVYLSAVFNGENGKQLSPDELKRAVLSAQKMVPPPSNNKLARDYGISPAQIGRIVSEDATRRRLAELVSGSDNLTQGQVSPLSKISLSEPFRQMANLIVDSQMSPTDIREVVKDLVTSSSEADQLDKIAKARMERAGDIESVKLGLNLTGTPIVDLRRMVGRDEKLANDFSDIRNWVTPDPDAIRAWAPRIAKTADHFAAISAAYNTALAGIDEIGPLESGSDSE